jgi:hypothetical protein
MPNLQFKYNQICKEIDSIREQAVITRADLIKIDLLTKIKDKIHEDIAHRLQDRLDIIGD